MYFAHNTQLNSQNPFPCNLSVALDKFFQTLAFVQNQQRSIKSIEKTYEQILDELDQQWSQMEELAQAGLVERVRIQLNNFMQDYAAQKALHQFLNEGASGWTLTRATPGLQDAMSEKLGRKHTQLTSLLVQILTNGMRAREEAQAKSAENLAQTRVQYAEQAIEREFGRNRDMHSLVMQALGKLEQETGKPSQAVRDAHDDARKSLEDARKSLTLAMSGARQVQDVFPLILGPAVKLAESANNLAASNNEHLRQQLPSYMEEVMVRADKRKRSIKLFWFVIPIVVMIGMPLLAFLLIHFFL